MKFLKKGETTEEREERHVFENFSLSRRSFSSIDRFEDLKSDGRLIIDVSCVCDGSRRPNKNLHICPLCFVSTDKNNNNGDDNARQHDDATRGERVSASMVL